MGLAPLSFFLPYSSSVLFAIVHVMAGGERVKLEGSMSRGVRAGAVCVPSSFAMLEAASQSVEAAEICIGAACESNEAGSALQAHQPHDKFLSMQVFASFACPRILGMTSSHPESVMLICVSKL